MQLKILLVAHALVTLAAAIVLIIAPAAIPKIVEIHLAPDAYLLSYLLGAAELAIAFLSFFSRNITDRNSLRIIAGTFIVFHLSTAILEVYGLTRGADLKLITNVILRLIISALFYYYGVHKIRNQQTR